MSTATGTTDHVIGTATIPPFAIYDNPVVVASGELELPWVS